MSNAPLTPSALETHQEKSSEVIIPVLERGKQEDMPENLRVAHGDKVRPITKNNVINNMISYNIC